MFHFLIKIILRVNSTHIQEHHGSSSVRETWNHSKLGKASILMLNNLKGDAFIHGNFHIIVVIKA